MRLLTCYLLACAGVAAVAATAMLLNGLMLLAGSLIVGDASFDDFGIRVIVAPIIGLVTIFGLLVAQSLPWVPVLIWAVNTRSRQALGVMLSPIFAAALFWSGAVSGEMGVPVIGVWSMPFGYVWIAAFALVATTSFFFFLCARFAAE